MKMREMKFERREDRRVLAAMVDVVFMIDESESAAGGSSPGLPVAVG